MSALRRHDGDESGSEFHLWIWAAQAKSFFDPGISIKTVGGIGCAGFEPLVVGFGKIADVKPGERIRMAGGVRVGGASAKPGDQFFRDLRILAGIDGGGRIVSIRTSTGAFDSRMARVSRVRFLRS